MLLITRARTVPHCECTKSFSDAPPRKARRWACTFQRTGISPQTGFRQQGDRQKDTQESRDVPGWAFAHPLCCIRGRINALAKRFELGSAAVSGPVMRLLLELNIETVLYWILVRLSPLCELAPVPHKSATA